MRKLFVLFVYMFLLLSSGSQKAIAGTNKFSHDVSPNVEKKHEVKLVAQDSGNFIIEESCMDVNEDFGGDINDRIPNKIFTGNYSLLDNWYLALSSQLLLNHYQKNFKIFAPFCGQSNPIYITHRVLRI